MSRSYKRFPIVKQERVDKVIWNRKLRRKNIDFSMTGSQYKKYMVNYDTWQYPWFMSEAIKSYYEREFIRKQYKSLEAYINFYKNSVIRK